MLIPNWNALIAKVITSNARCHFSTHPVVGAPSLPAVDAAVVLADHAAHVELINEKNFY